ncbi:hypothetical protein RUM43_010800 [Polyplax serrata]|uniref:Uncharacterized protein n=1 Tax=Polyplax serrata TaxID=468196 RepID=A0AAN8S3C2_POLSC
MRVGRKRKKMKKEESLDECECEPANNAEKGRRRRRLGRGGRSTSRRSKKILIFYLESDFLVRYLREKYGGLFIFDGGSEDFLIKEFPQSKSERERKRRSGRDEKTLKQT